MKLSPLLAILFLSACAGGTNSQRWSGYQALPLSSVPAGIPIPRANAAMRIPTDQQLAPRKIPEVTAPMPLPSFKK